MKATTQLSGVSRPFSLRFECCVCAICLFLSGIRILPFFSRAKSCSPKGCFLRQRVLISVVSDECKQYASWDSALSAYTAKVREVRVVSVTVEVSIFRLEKPLGPLKYWQEDTSFCPL